MHVTLSPCKGGHGRRASHGQSLPSPPSSRQFSSNFSTPFRQEPATTEPTSLSHPIKPQSKSVGSELPAPRSSLDGPSAMTSILKARVLSETKSVLQRGDDAIVKIVGVSLADVSRLLEDDIAENWRQGLYIIRIC